jgi:hypothetical protein
LLQDTLNVIKGRRLGYVEFGKRLVFGKGRSKDTGEGVGAAG